MIVIRDSRAWIRRLGAAAVVMAAISGTTLAAAQFGWLKKDAKGGYKRLENASRDFALEYPKDWLVLGGAGSMVLTLAEKKGEATVAIEHTRLNLALSKDEITDLFADLEADGVRERQPQAADVKAALADSPTRRIVVVEFHRPGLKEPERVRQYSIPAGSDLYRVVCSASLTQFQKFQPMFEHIASTFTLKSPQGTG